MGAVPPERNPDDDVKPLQTRQRRPFSLRNTVAVRIRRVAMWTACVSSGWRWLPTALSSGFVPLLLAYFLGTCLHQVITAVLLTAVVLPLAWQDKWAKGFATIALTFVAHSALAIALSKSDPAGAARIMPGGTEYWARQQKWITTGEDAEYELSAWVPAHATMLTGVAFFSFTSLGEVTFQSGMHQVDLMNFYNGQLINRSRNPVRSFLLGWHIWSVLRGIGFTLVSFEIVSLSLQFFSRQTLAPARRHVWRLGLGLAFLLGDGVAKYCLMEPVRLQLLENYVT